MQKRAFGKTDLSVSVLGFGAAPAAFLRSNADKTAAVIEQLLKAGANVIDTAASYPGSEQFLGERFSARRSEFVLISKCGQMIPESSSPEWSAATVTATVDRALKLLKTDHLDVMLLHSCDIDVLKKGDALGALAKARDAGKTRFIGYSGDNEAAAFAAGLADVDVIETSISVADQRNIDLVLPIAQKNNLGVIAKRPMANAAWKNREDQPGMYSDYAKTYTDRLRQMKITPTSVGFDGIDSELSRWPEMALRFTLGIEGVHTAIIGTTNPNNAADNLRYAEGGPLPEPVVRKLRDAFKKADPDGKWTGQI